LLGRIDGLELADPRIPFQIGELLYESERYAEAAASYLRAIQLDASRALVFFKLGEAFEASGQSHRAVYAFEQAILRTAEASELRKRSEWEIYKLTFVPIEASGFADSSLSDAIDAASDAIDAASEKPTAGFDEKTAGFDEPTAAEFSTEVSQIAWWARLGSRFRQYANQFDVRWIEPSGKIALEKPARKRSADTIGSVLEFGRKKPAVAGRWTLELVLEDDVVERQTFVIRPEPDRALQPL
jgi:tetratricopeptide (TPR) repeat protein